MKRLRRFSIHVVLVALFFVSLRAAGGAEDGAGPKDHPRAVAGSDPPEVEALGQRLRCPVCQGMPIGESPAPMAQDMMKQVRRMWAEGQSAQMIETFFTDRFGAWVLLDPPSSGVGLWVWLLPPSAMIGALIYVALRTRKNHGALEQAPVANGYGIAAGAANPSAPPQQDANAEAEALALAAIRRQVEGG